jgi:hypothetical protein
MHIIFSTFRSKALAALKDGLKKPVTRQAARAFLNPPNCLARSKDCENQAFQIGRSVIGLQFHLETTPSSVVAIINNCRDELEPSSYVQTESQILSAKPEQFRAINDLMDKVLAFF